MMYIRMHWFGLVKGTDMAIWHWLAHVYLDTSSHRMHIHQNCDWLLYLVAETGETGDEC